MLTNSGNALSPRGWARLVLVASVAGLATIFGGVTALASPQSAATSDKVGASSDPARSGETRAVGLPTKEPSAVARAEGDGSDPKTSSRSSSSPSPVSVEDRLRALEEALRLQNEKIEQMARTIDDQRQTIQLLNGKGGAQPATALTSSAVAVASSADQSSGSKTDTPPVAETQKKVDDLYKRFGAIRISGDMRVRLETFDNQGFDSLVEPAARRRARIRGRLAIDGTLNKNFEWGVRFATGVFTDPITTNQTLTDFFERKNFALERAFVRYDSKGDKAGVQLVAGKFEPTFRRTQLVWDDDINVEGASEALYFKTKTALRQIKFVGFELPFNEVSGGKDGVLYGGQAQTDWQFSPLVSANVNVGYYGWQRPDQVLFGLGAATTQVNGGITNGAPVSGNQNGALGTTNRLIRNAAGQPIGFLAGFDLFDVLGNLTWQATKKYPVTFTFDYVHNLTDRVRDEKNGYWVGGQFGRASEKGDWLAGYYFARIEQDAVLVPFNFSDILASNSRVHMPTFAYQVANGVTLQWTGLFSQRVNKIVASPVNRYLSRMTFDVLYKF